MPGAVSHYLCGAAAADRLDFNTAELIRRYSAIYNIGTQGPDVFFYYLPNALSLQTNIGSVMHREKTGSFIESLVLNADSLKGEEREKAFAYTAGYLTHYSLDAYAHPYIYYKTGTAAKSGKTRIKHSLYHRGLETAIDKCLIRLVKTDNRREKMLYRLIKAEKEDMKVIGELLSRSILKTYKVRLKKGEAQRAMKYMWRVNMLIRSKAGETAAFVEEGKKGNDPFYDVICEVLKADKRDYLNLNKKSWFLPWNHMEEKRESFAELFCRAVEESIMLIELLFEYMQGSVTADKFLLAVGSRSLISGLNEGEGRELYCFERK